MARLQKHNTKKSKDQVTALSKSTLKFWILFWTELSLEKEKFFHYNFG